MNRYKKRIAYKPARNRNERRRNARNAKFRKLISKMQINYSLSQKTLSTKHLLNNFPDTERRDELSATQKALSDKQLLPPFRPDVVIERGYISSQDAREATILIKEENKNA